MTGRPPLLSRWLRHLWVGPMHVRKAFGKADHARIEQAIADGERRHRAELMFAVESSLDSGRILARATARERALEVFSTFRIWDTEDNNGVLLYVLWADHAVEIVVDRGAARRVDPAAWARACELVRESFRAARHVDGVLAAIAVINDALAGAFPAGDGENVDELPNRPIVLR